MKLQYIKRLLSFVLGVIITVGVSGCGSNNHQPNNAVINFTDDDGNIVAMNAPAERIISLYSAHTENIYSLGAGDKLIGNYHTAIYPPEASKLDMFDYAADPEKIIAANPDVVLVRPFITRKTPDNIKALKKAGITVISLYPDTFDSFDDYINKLAKVCGKEDTAKELLEKFHAELLEISEQTEDISDKQKVFFETTETNIRTTTDDSMAGRAIGTAGGENIAKTAKQSESGSSIAEFGAEKVLMNADNIDVYISQRGAMNSGGSLESIAERDGFDVIKAVKNKRVYTINEKLISSPTFRYVKGVREIERFLYPEIADNLQEYKTDEIATKKDFADIIVKSQHMPIYVPSSSKYYDSEQKGHTFGMFEDVKWTEESFDNIETAVNSGSVEWEKVDGKEYYYPENAVTREELAKAVFILGDFKSADNTMTIGDIADCENKRIIETLVSNGVFTLTNGRFEPKKEVTKNEVIAALSGV